MIGPWKADPLERFFCVSRLWCQVCLGGFAGCFYASGSVLQWVCRLNLAISLSAFAAKESSLHTPAQICFAFCYRPTLSLKRRFTFMIISWNKC